MPALVYSLHWVLGGDRHLWWVSGLVETGLDGLLAAFTSGDPNMLLVPKDSWGGRCGLDEHVKDKPYLFFFDLTKCFGPFVPFTGCPTPQVLSCVV